MPTDTVQPTPCDKSLLFELAKKIYALHCAIEQLHNITDRKKYREELIQKLQNGLQQFKAAGGIVETGKGHFGASIPILSHPDPKTRIPYEIGRMDSEKLLNS